MIPALSIRQPWAWLIVNGHKDVENRDWSTSFRGPLLIHAGKTLTAKYYAEVTDQLAAAGLLPPDMPPIEALELGCFVGWTRVTGCTKKVDSPWKQPDTWGFTLTDSYPIRSYPWKGRLGFFNVPSGLVETYQAKNCGEKAS